MQSAQTVQQQLQSVYSAVFLLKITPSQWSVIDSKGQEQPLAIGQFDFTYGGKSISFDVIFNALHGSPGEDGQLAALLNFAGIPHTSCDMYTAALTFNKRDCIAIARRLGVPTAPSVILDQGEPIDSAAIEAAVGLPCFVKANRAGSSFGVFKARTQEELLQYIPKAFEEDSQLIIEKALDGREVSVGVVRLQGKTTVLPITEIVTENDFFDYAAKYEGESQEITPADLPATWEEKVIQWASILYDKLGLHGVSRSEFIFVNGIPHLLEINTVPGMTQASIIPQQCAAANLSLQTLFVNIVSDALQRNK